MSEKKFVAELVHGNVYILKHKIFRKNQPVAVDFETASKLSDLYDFKRIENEASKLAIQKFSVVEMDNQEDALSIERKYQTKLEEAEKAVRDTMIKDVVKAKPTWADDQKDSESKKEDGEPKKGKPTAVKPAQPTWNGTEDKPKK